MSHERNANGDPVQQGVAALAARVISLLQSRPPSASGRMEAAMRRLYDARMRLTGQNGISDYDLGFTNFLYTFETSNTARQNQRQAQ